MRRMCPVGMHFSTVIRILILILSLDTLPVNNVKQHPPDFGIFSIGQLKGEKLKISSSLSPKFAKELAEFEKRFPRKKHLKPKRLYSLLGNDFDSGWMSVQSPKGANEAVTVNSNDTEMMKLLDSIKPEEFAFSTEVDTQVITKLVRLWLLRRTSCPVQYKWYDIGRFYWPRYIRRGICTKSRTCSWPPGMHCVPAESHTIYILRWQCKRRRGKKPPKGNASNEVRAPRVAQTAQKRTPREAQAVNQGEESQEEGEPRANLPQQDGGSSRQKRRRQGRPHDTKRRRRYHCKWTKAPVPITTSCYCSC